MGVAELGRRRRFAPPPHERIDWSHPLAQGLVHCAISDGAGGMVTLLGIPYLKQGVVTGAGRTPLGAASAAAAGTNNTSGLKADASGGWLPTSLATMSIGYYKLDSTARTASAFGVVETSTVTTNRFGAHIPYSDGTVYFDFGGASGNNRITKAGLSDFNGAWSFVSRSGGLEMWQNGLRHSVGGGGVSRSNGATGSMYLFNGNTGQTLPAAFTGQDNAAVNYAYIHSRDLSSAEIGNLYADPFQFLVW